MKLSRNDWWFLALVVLVVAAGAFFLHGGIKDSAEKQCAESLVVIDTANECSARSDCILTLHSLRELNEAYATKQNVCPVDDNPSANN